MQPTCLNGTVSNWIALGIPQGRDLFMDLTPSVRDWLFENTGHAYGLESCWWWDHFVEEAEVALYFTNVDHATLFKLTWL